MNTAQLITVLTQLGLAGAAWRLANSLRETVAALQGKVADHETRLGVLERA